MYHLHQGLLNLHLFYLSVLSISSRIVYPKDKRLASKTERNLRSGARKHPFHQFICYVILSSLLHRSHYTDLV